MPKKMKFFGRAKKELLFAFCSTKNISNFKFSKMSNAYSVKEK